VGGLVDAGDARELANGARTVSDVLRGELREGMRDSASEFVRGAKSRVPIDSGRARDSLGVENADDGAMIVAGGRIAPYFHILEYGSKFMRGGHYLGKAIDAGLEDIERAALEAVKDAAQRGGFDVG